MKSINMQRIGRHDISSNNTRIKRGLILLVTLILMARSSHSEFMKNNFQYRKEWVTPKATLDSWQNERRTLEKQQKFSHSSSYVEKSADVEFQLKPMSIEAKKVRKSFENGFLPQRLVRKRRRRGVPGPRHYCKLELHPITANRLVYECRPSHLWRNELSLLTDDVPGNDNLAANESIASKAGTSFPKFFRFPSPAAAVSIRNAMIQWNVSSNVSSLRLHKQNIKAILQRSFIGLGENLRHLRLDSNGITHVSENAFKGLLSLRELDLSWNRLRSLSHRVFADLVGLRTLKLSHNQLEYVDDSLLACMTFLSYVDLSDNVIVDVHKNAFHHVTDAQSLVINVRRNRLTRPRADWLILPAPTLNDCPATVGHALANRTSLLKAFLKRSGYRTRIFWGEENPWKCSCPNNQDATDFLKTLVLLRFPESKSLLSTESQESECILRHQGPYAMRLIYFIPCADLGGGTRVVDLGSTLQAFEAVNQSCCSFDSSRTKRDDSSCEFITKWIDKNRKSGTGEESGGLTNGQVTVIGILIVVLSPVLLTLCPDCNQSSKPVKHDAADCRGDDKRFFSNRASMVFIRKFSKNSKT